jgi:transcription termination factor NusB
VPLRTERRDRVAVLTLDDPERRNALSAEMVDQIVETVAECEADDGVGAMVVTGAAPAFCSGADVSALGQMSGRDAGLATELVLGTLRRRPQLDYLAAHFSGRDSDAFDIEVRLALHLGIYQMRYLERIPPHAAISESVELVRRAGKRSATGFVNAILRNVTKDDVRWPDRSVNPR